MKNHNHSIVRLAIFLAWAGLALFALAQTRTADEILKDVDETVGGSKAPKDMEAGMTMRIVSPSGGEKVRELKVWSRTVENEDSWRVMKFLSPPDVRNIGFLALSDDQLYLYLPEFRRVRRIASHSQNESFQGSDFSYEDMGTGRFARSYTPRLLSEDAESWLLELERKPGSDKPSKRLRLRVLKESSFPVRIEMFDETGKAWKTAEQECRKIGSFWVLTKVTMRDLKAGSHTVLELSDIKVDQGIPDEVFTQRFLTRRVQ